MKSTWRVTVVGVVMVGGVALGALLGGGRLQLVPAVHAENGKDDHRGESCSIARLRGSFGFTTTGSIVAAGPIGLVASVGVLTFNGLGGVSQDETVSLNGTIVERSSVGTYFVDHDCTGNMSITLPPPAGVSTSNFVIVDDGKEMRFIVTGTGRVITTVAKKQ